MKTLTLDELLKPAVRSMPCSGTRRKNRCYACGGRGSVRMANGDARWWDRCRECGGAGVIEPPPPRSPNAELCGYTVLKKKSHLEVFKEKAIKISANNQAERDEIVKWSGVPNNGRPYDLSFPWIGFDGDYIAGFMNPPNSTHFNSLKEYLAADVEKL